MRRLSEMFDDTRVLSQLEEGLQAEEYLKHLDSSAEQRILALALNKIAIENPKLTKDEKHKKSRRIGKRKLLLAVLAAVFIGTITVSAQEGGLEGFSEMIESIWVKAGLKEHINLSSDQEASKLLVEYIEEDEENEHTVDEHSGVKVSVEQVISDGEDAYLYLEVEIAESIIPKQWPSKDHLYFRENYIQLGDGEQKRQNFQLHQETDGTIYGIVPCSLEDIEPGNVSVSLSLNHLDFAEGSGESRESRRLVEGNWNLKCNLLCEKKTKNFDIHAVVDTSDGCVTLTEAVVSPLSVRVSGTIESKDPTYSQLSCFIYQIILKDGTLMDCDGSYAQMQEGSEKITLKFNFDRMFDINEVVGVVVNQDSIIFQ